MNAPESEKKKKPKQAHKTKTHTHTCVCVHGWHACILEQGFQGLG